MSSFFKEDCVSMSLNNRKNDLTSISQTCISLWVFALFDRVFVLYSRAFAGNSRAFAGNSRAFAGNSRAFACYDRTFCIHGRSSLSLTLNMFNGLRPISSTESPKIRPMYATKTRNCTNGVTSMLRMGKIMFCTFAGGFVLTTSFKIYAETGFSKTWQPLWCTFQIEREPGEGAFIFIL